jgi:hypothetical protein
MPTCNLSLPALGHAGLHSETPQLTKKPTSLIRIYVPVFIYVCVHYLSIIIVCLSTMYLSFCLSIYLSILRVHDVNRTKHQRLQVLRLEVKWFILIFVGSAVDTAASPPEAGSSSVTLGFPSKWPSVLLGKDWLIHYCAYLLWYGSGVLLLNLPSVSGFQVGKLAQVWKLSKGSWSVDWAIVLSLLVIHPWFLLRT